MFYMSLLVVCMVWNNVCGAAHRFTKDDFDVFLKYTREQIIRFPDVFDYYKNISTVFRDENGNTGFILACVRCPEVALKMLDIHDVLAFDVNAVHHKHSTPLMLSCHREKERVAFKMLEMHKELGLNVNIQDDNGETAFMHLCSCSGQEERIAFKMLEMHKELGLNVNIQDNNGDTAFMIACQKNIYIALAMLDLRESLQLDINAINKKGETAFQQTYFDEVIFKMITLKALKLHTFRDLAEYFLHRFPMLVPIPRLMYHIGALVPLDSFLKRLPNKPIKYHYDYADYMHVKNKVADLFNQYGSFKGNTKWPLLKFLLELEPMVRSHKDYLVHISECFFHSSKHMQYLLELLLDYEGINEREKQILTQYKKSLQESCHDTFKRNTYLIRYYAKIYGDKIAKKMMHKYIGDVHHYIHTTEEIVYSSRRIKNDVEDADFEHLIDRKSSFSEAVLSHDTDAIKNILKDNALWHSMIGNKKDSVKLYYKILLQSYMPELVDSYDQALQKAGCFDYAQRAVHDIAFAGVPVKVKMD